MKRHHKPRVNYWALPNWYGFSLEMRETWVTDSWHAITRCHNHSMLNVLPVILWSMWWSMKNHISSQFPQCLLMFNSLSLEWEIAWRSMGKLTKEPGYILNQRVEKLHSKPARDVKEMLYIYIKISCCLIKKLVIFTFSNGHFKNNVEPVGTWHAFHEKWANPSVRIMTCIVNLF